MAPRAVDRICCACSASTGRPTSPTRPRLDYASRAKACLSAFPAEPGTRRPHRAARLRRLARSLESRQHRVHAMTPADRIAALRDEIRHHEDALLRPQRSRDHRRCVRRAAEGTAGARGSSIRSSSPRTRRRSESAGRPVAGFATAEHLAADAQPRQCLQRRRTARVRRARSQGRGRSRFQAMALSTMSPS